ncbi:helix-turn-helix domain-containing protein [Bizionia myxarmorum]|uniref:Helix-turn-helix transcriptional regulator n=1 Tax=Bizionia myxarmorum TaxID=291186 RepID=A0A5D0R9Z9_9FLAO|nr:helix-turn-helix transcriptional regulator [Bizionia myxarmorum]TYB78307.1 helix-turn-helix transcriptional regulator [Bizionia myxarmorum]
MKNLFTINLNYIKRINALDNNDLVKIIGLTSSTVSNLLNDKSTPNAETLLKISDEFKYSVDDLLKVDLSKRKGIYNINQPLGQVQEEIIYPLGYTPKTGRLFKTATPIENAINSYIETQVDLKTKKLAERLLEIEKLINTK